VFAHLKKACYKLYLCLISLQKIVIPAAKVLGSELTRENRRFDIREQNKKLDRMLKIFDSVLVHRDARIQQFILSNICQQAHV